MKINVTLEITPDAKAEGEKPVTEKMTIQIETTEGFGKRFNFEGLADEAREYASYKMRGPIVGPFGME